LFVTSTHAHIMFFTNFGRAFKIKCYIIPEAGRQAKGTAIVNLLQLQGGERITAAFPVTKEDEGEYLVMATRLGVIKKTELAEFDNIRRGGIIALGLRKDDELISVELSCGNDEFMLATAKGKSIRFHENDVRSMGRVATGVRSILLAHDDGVVAMAKVIPGAGVLTITENGKRTPEEAYRNQRRGGKGLIVMQVNERTGDLCGLKMVTGDEDLLLIRDDGMVLRTPVAEISLHSGRGTQGVRLMRADEGTRIAGVAIAPPVNEEEDITKMEGRVHFDGEQDEIKPEGEGEQSES